jgi:hypothetical protein
MIHKEGHDIRLNIVRYSAILDIQHASQGNLRCLALIMPLFSVSFGDELEAQGESVEISFDHFVKFELQLLSAAKRFQEMHLIHCDIKLLNLLDLIKHQYVNRLKEVMYLLISGLLATKDVRFYYGAYFQRIPSRFRTSIQNL